MMEPVTPTTEAAQTMPNSSRAFVERNESREIMQLVEYLFALDRLPDIDLLLYATDTDKLSSRAAVGLIRSTCRARTLLPSWADAYRRTWRAIERKGKDPAKLFVGLPLPDAAGSALNTPPQEVPRDEPSTDQHGATGQS